MSVANKLSWEEKKQLALDVLEKKRCFTIKEIVAHLPFSQSTWDNCGFSEDADIQDRLAHNIILTKQKLKHKWFNSSNPTLNIALFRLLADKDEHQKLTMSRIDHTTDDRPIRDLNKDEIIQKLTPYAEAEGISVDELLSKEGVILYD